VAYNKPCYSTSAVSASFEHEEIDLRLYARPRDV